RARRARLRMARERRRIDRPRVHAGRGLRPAVLRDRAGRPGHPARDDRGAGFGRKPNRGPSGRGGHPRRRGTSRRGSSRSRRGAGRARLREELQRAPPRPALRDAEELRAGHRGPLCVSLRRRANRRGVVRRDRRPADPHRRRRLPRIGRPQYAVAADAVGAMEDRVTEPLLVRALVAVGAGERFADAYAELGAGTLADFVAGFDATAAKASVAVSSTSSAAGDVAWTISGFAPDSAVVIRISGERGYDLAFTVRTDDLGMYRGSFGSTAPAGRYSID